MLTQDQIVSFIATGLMSGGGVAAVGAAASAWRNRSKVGPETDNIIVTGARSAVESLQEALQNAKAENIQLRASMREAEERHSADMERMSRQLDIAQQLLTGAQRQIDDLRVALTAVKNASGASSAATYQIVETTTQE